MKKVAVFVLNPIRTVFKHDQYDSFRGEGRISINVGFGLASLGFEVNLIFNEWKVDRNKEVWKNVYLSGLPKYDYYDYVVTWNPDYLKMVKFDKVIIMDWNHSQLQNAYNLTKTLKNDSVIYTSVSKHLVSHDEREKIKYPIKINYFPALFPIPSINIGFVPYEFKKKTRIRIYMDYRNSDKIISPKHKLIIEFLKNKKYEIDLCIHTKSFQMIEEKSPFPFKIDNITYLYDCETRYIDVLNVIKDSDICISSSGGSIVADIIGMGKPLIYITSTSVNPEKDVFFALADEHSELNISIYETDNESIKKLERFISNPKESYDKYAESYKDLEFNNWKEYAKQFFNPIETETSFPTENKEIEKEKIKDIVIDGYRNFLSREPDFDGFKNYVNKILSGELTIDAFFNGLKSSVEHKEMLLKRNIEIIAITTCGTYPCWIDYTIASLYNHVDKIIVVNGGYDIFNPTEALQPLKREHELLREIDIDKKILEINPTKEQIDQIFKTSCMKDKDEFGRSTNMTLATQVAHKEFTTSKPHWILKLDSDQILYKITREELENLVTKYPLKTGFRFAQYAGFYHNFSHIEYIPDEFTNDGALFHMSIPNQSYCGQGSPGRINVDQHPIYTIRTSHMRKMSCPGVERYEYFLKRMWYHTFGPNSIMELDYNRKTGKKLTDEEILKSAHRSAIMSSAEIGIDINSIPKDERIPYEPPLVCTMKPVEYIKKGF